MDIGRWEGGRERRRNRRTVGAWTKQVDKGIAFAMAERDVLYCYSLSSCLTSLVFQFTRERLQALFVTGGQCEEWWKNEGEKPKCISKRRERTVQCHDGNGAINCSYCTFSYLLILLIPSSYTRSQSDSHPYRMQPASGLITVVIFC